MGVHENIKSDRFPKQGRWLGKRTKVMFWYGGEEFLGTFIRDDEEEPFLGIIQLDDGRVVLTTECQHTVP